MDTVDDALRKLDELIKDLKQFLNSTGSITITKERLARWTDRAEKQLNDWGLAKDAYRLRNIPFARSTYDPNGNLYNEIKAKEMMLQVLHEDLAAHPESYTAKAETSDFSKPTQA